MEISLDQPDEVFHTSPDPRLEGVYFEPPQRLSDSEDESNLDISSEKKRASECTKSNSNSKNKSARTHSKSDKNADNTTKIDNAKSTTDRNFNSTDKGEKTHQLSGNPISAKDTTSQTNETCARSQLNSETVLNETAESATDAKFHSDNHDKSKEQSTQVTVLRGTTETSNMDFQEPPPDQRDVITADTNPGSSILPGNCLPINLGEEEIRPVITSLTRFNHKGATPYL